MRPLGELVDFLDSKRRPVKASERQTGTVPYYGANGQQGLIDGFLFDEPLVLLAEDGGYFAEPSRGIAYRIEGKSWVNNHAHVLRPRAHVELRYLVRVLENYDVRSFITGTTRGKLTKSDALRIPIPLPPLPEQRRIAEVLDLADALRVKSRSILDLLDDLAQSVFLDMFGDPLDNPYNLPLRTIGSLATVQIGPFGSLLHQDDYVADGIPLINPMHITDGRVVPDVRHGITSAKHASLPLYHLRSGDVIMARRGDMGRCAVVGSEQSGMLCGTGSLLIRTDRTKAMAPYLSAVLSQPSMKRHLERVALGITLRNLNRTIVEQLVIPAPPVSSQRTFARRLEAVEMLRVRAQRACQEKTRFFGSLRQRAFAGKF